LPAEFKHAGCTFFFEAVHPRFFKNLWSLGVVRSFAQVETVTTRLAQQVILEDQESLKEVRAWNGNDGLILALASTG